jgi:hypothetical protein
VSALLPLPVEQYLVNLSPIDQPVKVITDTKGRRVYWLSFTGEIYQMYFSGGRPERIIGGNGVGQRALFVQDFCVDAANNRIVFTDLRDFRTGHGAIKQLRLSDRQVSTLALLPGETPYRVEVNPRTHQLCYLTKSKGASPMYRLRTLHQQRALLVSFTKIQAMPGLQDSREEAATQSEEVLAYRQR